MIISVNEMKALVREIANLQGKGCESWLERQETAARKRLKKSGIEEQTLSVKDVISILENVSRWLKNDEEYGQQRYSTIFRIDSDNCESIKFFDWLNAHHFDYRGLIRKKLALSAPKGTYNY